MLLLHQYAVAGKYNVELDPCRSVKDIISHNPDLYIGDYVAEEGSAPEAVIFDVVTVNERGISEQTTIPGAYNNVGAAAQRGANRKNLLYSRLLGDAGVQNSITFISLPIEYGGYWGKSVGYLIKNLAAKASSITGHNTSVTCSRYLRTFSTTLSKKCGEQLQQKYKMMVNSERNRHVVGGDGGVLRYDEMILPRYGEVDNNQQLNGGEIAGINIDNMAPVR